MQIDYTAKRSIQAGHTEDSSYTININLSVADRVPESKGSQAESLSGNTVTVVHNLRVSYVITTELVTTLTTPSLSDMREFLDSVKGGESFTTDIDGTTKSYRLKSFSSPYSEKREATSYFRYSFTIIEIQ